MSDFTPAQAEIVQAIDRALCDAARAGLVLRVYEGAVFVMKAEAIEDPRYGLLGPTRTTWEDELEIEIIVAKLGNALSEAPSRTGVYVLSIWAWQRSEFVHYRL